MTKKRIWILLAVLLLLATFALTAIAILRPAQSSGSYTRDLTDRVRISVENTDFVLPEEAASAGEAEISFTLRAKKTEADFYAVIHSVALEGLDFESMIFQTVGSTVNYQPEELALPAEKGEAKEITWNVTVRFDPAAAPETFDLVIDYTSGMTPTTADEHILTIPMHLEFT